MPPTRVRWWILTLLFVATTINYLDRIAFGILVPKRFAKRAIDRNTLKRLIREACRNEVKLEKGRLLVRLTKSLVFVGEMDRIKWWEEIRQLLSSLSSH